MGRSTLPPPLLLPEVRRMPCFASLSQLCDDVFSAYLVGVPEGLGRAELLRIEVVDDMSEVFTES